MTAEQDKEVIPRSRLNAEQVLRKLLELIQTSQTIADFTPERLQGIEGGVVKYWKHGYGIAAELTPQWIYVLEVRKTTLGTFATFRFARDPSSSPTMADICQLDFDGFVAELETLGYDHKPDYAQPPVPMPTRQLPSGEVLRPPPPPKRGRFLSENFRPATGRAGLYIKVGPRGESSENPRHRCVETVWIE